MTREILLLQIETEEKHIREAEILLRSRALSVKRKNELRTAVLRRENARDTSMKALRDIDKKS
jgi:hypothetical protein